MLTPFTLLASLITVLLLTDCVAQTPPVIREQTCLGGTAGDFGSAALPTLDGGSIVAGYTASSNGQVTGFHGGNDFWVVKLDRQGVLEWQTCAGGSGLDRASDIAITADGGYLIVGATYSADGDVSGHHGGADLWIVKLHARGTLEWSRCLGGSADDVAVSIVGGANGSFLIAGYSNSTDGDVTGNHGGNDLWLLEVDPTGAILWQQSIGGTGDDRAGAVIHTDDGIVVVGQTTSPDGDVSGALGGKDFWLVKCTAAGNLEWQRCLGGTADDWGITIVATADGGYVAGGGTLSTDGDVTGHHGSTDAWVVKVDALGALEWQTTLGGSGIEIPGSIVRTNDGRTVAFGYTNSTDGDVIGIHGSWDAWIVELDAGGAIFWQNCYGGTNDDRGMRMRATEDLEFVCTGWTYSNDGDVSGNHGGGDMWALRLSRSFNRIRGTIHWDLNANGILDGNEPRAEHKRVFHAATGRQAFADRQGGYELNVFDTGTFVVETYPEGYFAPVPASWTCDFPTMLITEEGKDFSLQADGIVNDLRVSLNPAGAFRPGFLANYWIHYANVGNTTLAPTLIFTTEQPATFFSSSVSPSFLSSDSVTWELAPLAPFTSGSISARVQLDPATPIGSFISSTAYVRPVVDDVVPADNVDAWRTVVTGAYDPNDILVDRAVITPEELAAGTPLEYIIRFQNTGTDTAFNVLLRNPLPANVRPETFSFIAASHDVELAYANDANIMWFRFNNILLADSNTNEPLSHGYVRYGIAPVPTLIPGDSVLDAAAIFFDFNAPIFTNTAFSVVEQPMAAHAVSDSPGFGIHPVPATTTVRIAVPAGRGAASITVCDAAGRVRTAHGAIQDQTQLDVSSWPRGLYFIRLTTAEGTWTRRLILH
jgi:uncharacterized repeat protein (TIGR01451 family)